MGIFDIFKKPAKQAKNKTEVTIMEKQEKEYAEEDMRNIVKGINPAQDVLKELQYMQEHPCSCGGQYQRIQGGSAFPKFVYSLCKCEKCGEKKMFTFHF